MYTLNDIDGITPKEVERQRALWLRKIEAVSKAQGECNKLLNLVFLERATAGLNLDALSINPNKAIAEYLVQSTREHVKKFIVTLT